jgi:hypothetical protein
MHNFRCRLMLKHVRFVLPTTRRHPILPRDYRDAGMCKRLHPTISPHIVPDPVGANEYMCTGGNTNFNTCIALITVLRLDARFRHIIHQPCCISVYALLINTQLVAFITLGPACVAHRYAKQPLLE